MRLLGSNYLIENIMVDTLVLIDVVAGDLGRRC